ncbi:MAG: threonine-phosphate decarboxylase, partial [Selenomonadaceae bacterium]|nr:threonine-phosphate decarboxylase [Selenomonadaceae bacterium]
MERYEHGGQVYDAAGKFLGDWLDFSANINPLGLSEKILQALTENLRGVVNYPDPNATELKRAISQRYDLPEKNLVLLNGAAEFFYLYLNVTRPARVVIPVPAFSEYERAASAAGCEVKFFFTRAEENFSLNVDLLRAELNPADCVIIGRPNNPTGNLIAVEEILRLAEVATVLVDESFIDFIDVESVRKSVSEKFSVVQSLTKIFAIPGLRLGFAVVEENLARRLNLSKDVWNVNFLAQKAGVAASSDKDFLRRTRAWLAVEQKFFVERLKNLRGVKVFPPTVNFVLFKHTRAEEILSELRREKILLRSCANFAGLDGSYLRSAIRSREENLRLL